MFSFLITTNILFYFLICRFVFKENLAIACVDFGGFQDHSVNGGDDVLTIGYSELIGPMLKSIQELLAIARSIESRLSLLEGTTAPAPAPGP